MAEAAAGDDMAKRVRSSSSPTPAVGRRPMLSMDLAEALASDALARSRAMGRNTVVAVCDDGGTLKAFRRPDRSNLGCVDLALTKARSAVRFNTATHAFWPAFASQPDTQMGMAALPGFTVEGGGAPIRLRGQMIGGIGVSGAQNWQEDVDIIAAVFVAFGLDPVGAAYVAPKAPSRGASARRS